VDKEILLLAIWSITSHTLLKSHVKREVGNLREGVIKCLALFEALINFGEGVDLEEGVYD
jgi:hypothetical protein